MCPDDQGGALCTGSVRHRGFSTDLVHKVDPRRGMPTDEGRENRVLCGWIRGTLVDMEIERRLREGFCWRTDQGA
jgi:hypothetical protein